VTLILSATLGLALGAWTRRWRLSFDRVMRFQLVVLAAPLSFITGWSIHLDVNKIQGILVLLVADAACWAAGRILLHNEDDAASGLATGSMMNTGFWAMPVAVWLGHGALPFVVLFDQGTAPVRGSTMTWLLRKGAPSPQKPVTRLSDYAPQAAMIAGGLARLVGRAPGWTGSILPVLALVVSVGGFLLLARAWPARLRRPPRQAQILAVLRFTVAPLLLVIAAVAGFHPPAGAWVLAIGCSWFSFLSYSRMYGYRTEIAAGTIMLNMAASILLLPVLWLIVH
jgi:hypothetical protein